MFNFLNVFRAVNFNFVNLFDQWHMPLFRQSCICMGIKFVWMNVVWELNGADEGGGGRMQVADRADLQG